MPLDPGLAHFDFQVLNYGKSLCAALRKRTPWRSPHSWTPWSVGWNDSKLLQAERENGKDNEVDAGI